MSDFFQTYIFNNIIFFKNLELGQVAEGRRSPEFYPLLPVAQGEGHSTQPHNFKTLRAVGIDNPRLKGQVERVRTQNLQQGWRQCPGGGGGQDISQRSRVHTGIYMSTPSPKRLHRGQAQSRATGGQIVAPAPSESSSSLKWGGWRVPILDAQSLHLSSAPKGFEGWGRQAERWVAVTGPLLGGL